MPNHTYTQVHLQGSLPIMDTIYSNLSDYATDEPGNSKRGFLAECIGDPADRSADDNQEAQHPVLKEAGMPRWYEDRLQGWGTKWDVYHIRDVQTDIVAAHAGFDASRIVTCKWDTAWSPCIPAMLKLSAKYDIDVQLKYLDEGLFYCGQATIIKGETNLIKDYEGEDVYRGVYEVFGKDHFLGLMYEMDIEYLKSILKLAKKFADKQTINKLKQHIKSEMAA
jgi:hypothetical protein